MVDISIALWIKKEYHDVPEKDLYKEIKESKFDARIFVPNYVENFNPESYIWEVKKYHSLLIAGSLI
ncbi:hypothetical protein [Caldisphaera lagunensis]|uniref:hypothetical protein n=1 Tax=Caldisphaera lagunensis TaxID=200415 RepID=UPI000661FFE0|nr:hypothetical protein [Caldisphaera lagunensis]